MAKQKMICWWPGKDKHIVGSKYSIALWKKADCEILSFYLNAGNEE